ncbi:MAG: hypothetical protein LBQ12_05370 [Deltaproteobacteria bacterium]|jgi:hypothetical protein|nr:hypothetical protein [Deltaproteobacteria bacterium]
MSNLSKLLPASRRGSRNSARNIAVAALAVAAIIAAVFVIASHFAGAKAWESFSAALDRAAGKGAWVASGHSFSLLSKTLTVDGLALNFPSPDPGPSRAAAPAATLQPGPSQDGGDASGGQADDSAAGDLPEPASGATSAPAPARREGTFVRIDTVTIQGGPDRDALESLVEKGVLPPGDGGTMFKLLSMEGLAGEKTMSGLTTEFEINRLAVSDLALKPTLEEAIVGSPDFLKSVTAARIELAGYRTGFASPAVTGENFTMSLDEFSAESISLGPGFSNADNNYDFLRNLSAAVFRLTAFKTSVSSGGVEAFAAEAGELALSGLLSGGLADSFTGKGIKVTMRDPAAPDFAALLTLDSYDLVRPDFTVPLARAGDTADRLATAYYTPSVSRIWQDFPRVSDLVSFPFGLERGTVQGLGAAVEPGPSVRIARGVVQGPFKAQELPNATLELTSLVYTPPPDPESLKEGLLREATLLLPYLGQEVLEINAKVDCSADGSAGTYRVTLNELTAKGAAELTGSVALEGMHSALLPPLSQTPLSDLVGLSFDKELDKVALQRVQLNYSDRGLLPAYYSLLSEVYGQEATDVRDAFTRSISKQIRDRLEGKLVDIEPLLSEIASFLAAPGTFSASAAPDPPLSHSVATAFPQDDPAAVQNALNISVTANGAEPAVLRFKAPEAAVEGSGDS